MDLRSRFPGLSDGWARFDGPAGTQVVDTAIEATADWQRSGANANAHGPFPHADACDRLVHEARTTLGALLGADPAGIVFGASTTANLFHLARALARTLGPGDEIVCTRLDHDANVAPWLTVAAATGATVLMADVDTDTGRLPTAHVVDLIGSRTRWVAVTAASNAVGSLPDVAAISAAAHEVGARVVVDGVHRTPHGPVDVAALGADVYATSAYKWYGPHLGVLWIEPGLLAELRPDKVRPSPDVGPDRFQLGTPAFELIAGTVAAARFLDEVDRTALHTHEMAVFARLLDGLGAIDGLTILGPRDLDDRAPTLAFVVDGLTPGTVARRLADERIAVWDGDYYAVEFFAALGRPEGAVRAGVVGYLVDDDVDRLLEAVDRIASGR